MEIEYDNSEKTKSEAGIGFGFVDPCSQSDSVENKDQNKKQDTIVDSVKTRAKKKQKPITLFLNSKKRAIDQISNNIEIEQNPIPLQDAAQSMKLVQYEDESSSDNDLLHEGAIVFEKDGTVKEKRTRQQVRDK